MDHLQQLKVFVTVAEMASFTKAAESLSLPKASASTMVQRLENKIGTRLLQRTTRSVRLTTDGMAFYDRCKYLLSDVEDLQSMFLKEVGTTLSGKVRVDMPSRMARFQVIPHLPKFLQKFPGIEIEIGTTDRFVDIVREGYDFVVRVGALSDSSLVAKKIGAVPICNCASPAYLEKFGRPRAIAQLKNHLQVGYVGSFGGKPDGFEFKKDGRYETVPMRQLITVNNAEAYVAACLAGFGIIQSPRASLEGHLQAKELIEVLPGFQAEPMPVSFVYPHQRNLPRRVKAFMNWLEPYLKKEFIEA
jgi:DNA-binding transcriptional LysR family regulator